MIIKWLFIKIAVLAVSILFVIFYLAPETNHIQPKEIPFQEGIVFEEENEKKEAPAAPIVSMPEEIREILVPAKTESPITEKPALESDSKNVFTAFLIDALEEKTINAESIVAIQCIWDYTYPENVSEDPRFHSKNYFQGSGIVISSKGHILTVNHVLDNELVKKPDPTGKKWFLEKCQTALTNKERAPLPYNSPRFKETEIIFQPSSEYYDYESEDRVDFDFALLKFKEAGNYNFTPLFDYLIDSGLEEKSMILAGYPGAALTGKREFKTIEFFSSLEKYRGRGVGSSALFYQAGSKQYKAASDSYKKFQEELFASGQDNRIVRGGFSGSPVFVKGYLIGIVISSSLPYAESQDMLLALSSYSISELLKKHGSLLQ